MTNSGITDYAQTRYLTNAQCNFTRTDGGFLSLRVDENEEYPRVFLSRLFPFGKPFEYISVRDKEQKEIGIIRDVEQLSSDTKELVLDELTTRYFVPKILKINEIKEEFGYLYINAETTSGDRRFTLFDLGSNILRLSDNTLLLIDIDGNRFEIPDYTKLDKRSYKFIGIWV